MQSRPIAIQTSFRGLLFRYSCSGTSDQVGSWSNRLPVQQASSSTGFQSNELLFEQGRQTGTGTSEQKRFGASMLQGRWRAKMSHQYRPITNGLSLADRHRPPITANRPAATNRPTIVQQHAAFRNRLLAEPLRVGTCILASARLASACQGVRVSGRNRFQRKPLPRRKPLQGTSAGRTLERMEDLFTEIVLQKIIYKNKGFSRREIIASSNLPPPAAS